MLVNAKTIIRTSNTTIQPDGFYAWRMVNGGTATLYVMGQTVAPGDLLDMTHVPAEAEWQTPISVVKATGEGTIRAEFLLLYFN